MLIWTRLSADCARFSLISFVPAGSPRSRSWIIGAASRRRSWPIIPGGRWALEDARWSPISLSAQWDNVVLDQGSPRLTFLLPLVPIRPRYHTLSIIRTAKNLPQTINRIMNYHRVNHSIKDFIINLCINLVNMNLYFFPFQSLLWKIMRDS